MNPFAIAGGSVGVIDLPLRRPFITAQGRKDSARNAAITLRLSGGATGYGEACPSLSPPRRTPETLAAALRRLLARFAGRDARREQELTGEIWASCPYPAAAAAFECAVHAAKLEGLGASPAQWWGSAALRLETDLTISASSAEEAFSAAGEASGEGFRRFKIKVAGDLKSDLARAAAVDAAGNRPALLLDGNQAMSLRSALALTEACLKRGLRVELLEQPLKREDWSGMARLRRLSPVPIAADESLRSAADALKLIDLDAADVLNIKAAKTGLAASLEIIALARAAGKKLMIGCMAESARGLSPSVHLALGTGAFSFVDLDFDRLLAPGQPAGTFVRRGPMLSLE